MKARFDLRFPLNGRYTPAQSGDPTPPRCHTSTDRPSSKQVPVPDEADASGGIGTELDLKLEDEILISEIESYTRYLISFTAHEQENPELRLVDLLPAYARLQDEYADARAERKEQQNLAKKLVQAAEPLLNNGAVAEKEKQGLLSVTELAVEKVMQLKMRTMCIMERLNFLKQIIPQYVRNYAKLLGQSDEFCQQVEQRAQEALLTDIEN